MSTARQEPPPSDAECYARALESATGAMVSGAPLEQSLRAVLSSVQFVLRADHAFVYTLDDGGQSMTMRAGTGLFENKIGISCAPKTGLAGKVWASGELVRVDDYESWTGRGIDIQAGGARALLALPIRAGQDVLGVLGLAHSRPQLRFATHASDRIQGLANLLAILLLNDRTTDRARAQQIERTQVEDELRHMRAEEQRILDLVPAMIWVKDRENRILRANRTAAQNMGLSVEEIEGQFLWEIDPEHAARSYREDLEVIETGAAREGILEETVDLSGERRWFRVDRAPIHDATGAVTGVVVLSSDVTESHLAETTLKASRDAADRANRVKDHYLATMSHEVHAPLQSMLSLAERLLHRDLPAELRDSMAAMHASTDSLLTLVQDVLDFARAEAGNLDTEVRDFEPRILLEDVLDVMAQLAHQRDVELASHVDVRVPRWVAGDPVRIRQILIQMLAAALRISREGEILVLAKLVMLADDAVELRFEVRAPHHQLDRRELERLFSPLIDSEEPDRDEGAAAEVGLALASRLVELLQGRVTVESDAHEGLRCCCTLRFARAIATTPDADELPEPTPGARVLVVDDNARVSGFLQQQLTEMRMLVDAAESIEDGIEMLRASQRDDWPYEFCLIDDRLGGRSGRELATAFWGEFPSASTRMVLMVPFGQPIAATELERCGLADAVTRPVRNESLRRLLTQSLGTVEADTGEVGRDHLANAGAPVRARVLVVEEERLEQKLVTFALRRMGCEVDVAASATDALDCLHERGYDLVLLDEELPWVDGLRAVDRIRQLEGADRHTPVVAMVGSDGQADHERCVAAGMDGCIAKPLRHGDLRELLRTMTPVLA